MCKFKIELKWAVIFALMMLLWMFFEKLVGLHEEYIDKHPIYTNLIALPAVYIYFLALFNKRQAYYFGNMTYIQGLISGLIITLFVTVMVPLIQYITSVFITPVYFENAIDFAVGQGKMSQAEAEAYFNLKNYIIMGLIGTPIMGSVTAAIVALFTRKRKLPE